MAFAIGRPCPRRRLQEIIRLKYRCHVFAGNLDAPYRRTTTDIVDAGGRHQDQGPALRESKR